MWYKKNRSEDQIRLQNQHKKVANLSYSSFQKKDDSRNSFTSHSKANPKYLEKAEIDLSNIKIPNENLPENIDKSSDFRGLITIDFKKEIERLEDSTNKNRRSKNNDFKSLPLAKSFYCEKYSQKLENSRDEKNQSNH